MHWTFNNFNWEVNKFKINLIIRTLVRYKIRYDLYIIYIKLDPVILLLL